LLTDLEPHENLINNTTSDIALYINRSIGINIKMMKNLFLSLVLLACSATAFVVPDTFVAQPSLIATQDAIQQQINPTSLLQDGVRNYLASPFEESSTMTLSLKERPPPPTAEELAAKKRNFNFWFWGGGFVAPFLATFYYFGFKFWER